MDELATTGRCEMIKKTATQERNEMRCALAKSIIHQITALNRTVANANQVGIDVRFILTGINRTPEIQAMYVSAGHDKIKDIAQEAYYD